MSTRTTSMSACRRPAARCGAVRTSWRSRWMACAIRSSAARDATHHYGHKSATYCGAVRTKPDLLLTHRGCQAAAGTQAHVPQMADCIIGHAGRSRTVYLSHLVNAPGNLGHL